MLRLLMWRRWRPLLMLLQVILLLMMRLLVVLMRLTVQTDTCGACERTNQGLSIGLHIVVEIVELY